jgi:hypothetical protein
MALTYCDMITGAAGEVVTLAERLADVERRYGVGHVVTRSVYQAQPEVERCIQVVESRLGGLPPRSQLGSSWREESGPSLSSRGSTLIAYSSSYRSELSRRSAVSTGVSPA